MVSILVIALVVWLILVFFSVTRGLEKNWINQLIALTAPVRVTPTEAYFDSYYHLIDGFSEESNFAAKSLREKLHAPKTDPYDSRYDQILPSRFPAPLRAVDGSVVDLTKEAMASIQAQPDVQTTDFEMTYSNLRLRMIRRTGAEGRLQQSFVNQATYLNSFAEENPRLQDAMMPFGVDDLSNLLSLQGMADGSQREDEAVRLDRIEQSRLRQKLHKFFANVTVTALKGPVVGWQVPIDVLPQEATFAVAVRTSKGVAQAIYLLPTTKHLDTWMLHASAEGLELERAQLVIKDQEPRLVRANGSDESVIGRTPIRIPQNILLPATLGANAVETATTIEELPFELSMPVQGAMLAGRIEYLGLTLGAATVADTIADSTGIDWFHHNASNVPVLPRLSTSGEGVIIAKQFRDSGVLLGDRGYLSFYTTTTSGVQEQRIPIYVAGFCDPGVVGIGGKMVTISRETTSIVRSAQGQTEDPATTGFNVWCGDESRADSVKAGILAELKKRGIDGYWKVETFREYEFSRDLIQQLQSEKNLFSVISVIIILVACSNIITMLILLVNDKKVEIGILRSMGASSMSIAAIFGTCGVVMGALGSVLGTAVAYFTLRNLQGLIDLLSSLQGHVAFNEAFYGKILPNAMSYEALTLVWSATVVLSLLAGLVPAIKATLLKPSAILRAEG